MRASRRIVPAVEVLLLCMSCMCAAATRPDTAPVVIQLSLGSSFLDLSSYDRTATLRQTSVPVHIAVTGATIGSAHPIEIYAGVATEEAMRLAGKVQTIAAGSLRIRNDRGEWAELEPLPELEGRRGVRIAVLNGTSATVLLQVQLQVPAGQVPGRYQGALTLEAQERQGTTLR